MTSLAPHVLLLLRGVRKTANGWDACCPAHDDQHPSLGVAVRDGKVLLHCRSHGCTAKQIAAALGLSLADLLHIDPPAPQPRIVATYDYHDATGQVIFQVVRLEPKSFRQ